MRRHLCNFSWHWNNHAPVFTPFGLHSRLNLRHRRDQQMISLTLSRCPSRAIHILSSSLQLFLRVDAHNAEYLILPTSTPHTIYSTEEAQRINSTNSFHFRSPCTRCFLRSLKNATSHLTFPTLTKLPLKAVSKKFSWHLTSFEQRAYTTNYNQFVQDACISDLRSRCYCHGSLPLLLLSSANHISNTK